ncbi:MAG: hypothetical protein QOE99_1936, partial [Actinomycetota bacterium]|nr:hypothetical protein [Actinomycetota bacterium]
MLEFCLVLAKGQNGFFFEFAEAIADELRSAGHRASISVDGFPPPREDLVYLLVPPHEYFRLEGIFTEPPPEILARTIFVCAEQPGTSFFDDDVFLAPRAGAVFDINLRSVKEFRRRGVPGVRHLPLGWTPTWSPVAFEPGQPVGNLDRPVDVLHMGIYSANRGRALGAAAKHLMRWESRLILADDSKANSEQRANFLMDSVKWDALRRARVVLNVHVAERPYFEWMRVVQAIGAGCAVVSEHSAGYAPLVPGEHLIFGKAETLGLLTQQLLDEEERRWELARDAWLFLRDELPFSRAVAGLIDAGHEIAARPLPADHRTAAFARRRRHSPQAASLEARDAVRAVVAERYPSDVAGADASRIRAGIKDLRLELMGVRREQARRDLRAASGGIDPPRVEEVRTTRAYAAGRPRVSVITALYNYERHIAAALDSAAESRGVEVELVVVDDGSSDGSLAAVEAWCDRSEDIPARILRHPVNQGLGAARNTAIDFARGEFVFVLDADNEVFGQGISRLVDVIDQDPDAVFSYGMLEVFDQDGPVGVQSAFPWEPERFKTGNFIDAMALVRRQWLVEHGGYTTDRRLHGWEDFDLW